MAWVVLAVLVLAPDSAASRTALQDLGVSGCSAAVCLRGVLDCGKHDGQRLQEFLLGTGGRIHRAASLLVLEPEKRKGDKVKGRNEEEGKIRTFRARANPFLIGHLSSVISHRSDK